MSQDPSRLRYIVNPDGAAILDAQAGVISTLNSTAAYIWRRLHAGEPIECVIDALAEETGLSRMEIEGDLRQFSEELRQHKLIAS